MHNVKLEGTKGAGSVFVGQAGGVLVQRNYTILGTTFLVTAAHAKNCGGVGTNAVSAFRLDSVLYIVLGESVVVVVAHVSMARGSWQEVAGNGRVSIFVLLFGSIKTHIGHLL